MSKFDSSFFDEPQEHSLVKIEIVAKYFAAWLAIMNLKSNGPITYLDLFSGPGKYRNGKNSTPQEILNVIIRQQSVHKKVKVIFHESNEDSYELLRKLVREHKIYGKLKEIPEVNNQTVNTKFVSNMKIRDSTCTFIDPSGFKDISFEMISLVIKGWGNDCILVFNTSGIIRNLKIDEQASNMKKIFGNSGFNTLLNQFRNAKSVIEKENYLLAGLREAVSRELNSDIYFLSFGLGFEKSEQTCYYLVFFSKHYLGFEKMRKVMIDNSLTDENDFPLYYYSKIERQKQKQIKLDLMYKGNLQENLEKKLSADFSKSTIKIGELLDECLKERKYIYNNMHIKKSLQELEISKKIELPDCTRTRNKLTYQKNDIIKFL